MLEKLSDSFANAIKYAVIHKLTPLIIEGRSGWVTGYGRRFWVIDPVDGRPREVHAMVHFKPRQISIHVLWHGEVINEFGAEDCIEDVRNSYRIAAEAIEEFGLTVTVKLL